MADGTNINLEAEVEDFKERCRAWFEVEASADNAGRFRDLIALGGEIEKRIETRRKAEKQPHTDAAKVVDDAHKVLSDPVAKAREFLKKRLTAFVLAEEDRRRREAAEAARIAEEARKAAEAQPDPFAAFDATQAEERASAAQSAATARIQVTSTEGVARAASLKVVGYNVTVTDAASLVAHFAAHPDVIEAARKVAAAQARATKGAVSVPGVEITPERKVA